ncbi:hypothetical protein [Sediminibacterium soli]|uniref:hypothetical protein n=1 Tax=Sediminibacterium soli TaxID=2698829 RepID=UPI00137B5932|nr:hypothetical protein [Sediminibacterium soli]NCI47713.1 hypothetical protein [Sediminibacterium soli]
MKNLVIVFAACVLVLGVSAQEKITKSKLIGKWSLAAVEMKNMFYFDIEKDSLALGDMITSQVTDPSQLELVKTTTKGQLAMLKSIYFQFNNDGSTEFNSGTGDSKGGTYTVDEEKSTITTTDKSEKSDKQTIPAEIVAEKLRLTMSQPQGDFVMLLKKSK